MKKKLLFFTILILLTSSCSVAQKPKASSVSFKSSKLSSKYFEESIILINNDKLTLSVFENNKYYSYQLDFVKNKFHRSNKQRISEKRYEIQKSIWQKVFSENLSYSSAVNTDFKKIKSKKEFGFLINHFDKLENYQCNSTIEIIKNKEIQTIEINNTNIIDFKVLNLDGLYYLIIVQAAEGSGGFSSSVSAYQIYI